MSADPNTLYPHELESLNFLSDLTKSVQYPTISESLFVNKYLPILTYNYTRPESEHLQVKVNSLWVNEVALNPYNEVNVVSDSDNKTLLFWVPPLLRRGKVFKQEGGRDSFFNIMEEAHLQDKVMPGAKDYILNRAVEDRLRNNNDLTEDQKQWYYILSYYKIYQYGEEPVKEENASTIPNTNTIIFEESDEL